MPMMFGSWFGAPRRGGLLLAVAVAVGTSGAVAPAAHADGVEPSGGGFQASGDPCESLGKVARAAATTVFGSSAPQLLTNNHC
ncbi:hypothetical protein AB0K09_20055 [Streptomyces sp. NPDC049577]|uniref:hypothetical protein n=1 Tax=Streptomyces sp. NPDC049577 TaxID=3155153 RepID=UPI00342A40E0